MTKYVFLLYIRTRLRFKRFHLRAENIDTATNEVEMYVTSIEMGSWVALFCRYTLYFNLFHTRRSSCEIRLEYPQL